MKKSVLLVFVLLLMLGGLSHANQTFWFTCITNNNSTNAEIGENQLSLDVTDIGQGQALFTFSNSGSKDAVVKNIIFEDSKGLLDFDSFSTSANGVNFVENNKNLNLPGGNAPPVYFNESYGFSANAPAPKKGVGPGESLGIVFDLNGTDFNGLVSSMQSDQLRIGTHVIAYQNNGSESFISKCRNGVAVVPVPGALILAAFGLAAIRFKKS